jgi:hypothetical protein
VLGLQGVFKPLTSVSSTDTVNSLSKSALFALTGVSSSASLGNVLKQVSYGLSGIQSIDRTGTIATQAAQQVFLTGVSTSTVTGTIATTGGQITGTPISGVVTSTAANILYPEIVIPLSGVQTDTITGQPHVIGDFPEVTGTTQEATEFIQFTAYWELPANVPPNTLVSYTFAKDLPGVELYAIGNTVYASGQADDVFPRTIEYVDENMNLMTVSRFVDLPIKYFGITRYIPPEVQFKSFYVLVDYYDEVLLETKTLVNELIVRYNFDASNKALKDAVKREIA